MQFSEDILQQFEKGLDPQRPERSEIPAVVVGFGEISSIFKINPYDDWVFKRMPLFDKETEAKQYAENYSIYTLKLKEAGLRLPKDFIRIVSSKKVVLYIAQEAFDQTCLCQNKLHSLSHDEVIKMLEMIFTEIKKIFIFNEKNHPETELSIDGQISNWALKEDQLYYFDTSTPLFKLKNTEQLDPELLLNSTPKALRWIIRKFFLQEVMDRYYNIRLVYIDVIANLYKEQKPDLIDETIDLANKYLPEKIKSITRKEIDKYYAEDKFIWQLFLTLRRMDRWITTRVMHKTYEFILPGKIKR
jgi:hypothetical protein